MLTSYLLITLIAIFGHCEDFLGTSLLSRPLVLGPLVGLVLGNMEQGIIIGATLELIFMGNIKVGAAIPPDVITGGVLSTAFAIISGKGAPVALAIALPISILAEMVISGLFVFRSVFNKKFEAYAEEGDYRKIERLHIFSGLLKPALMGLITFLALQLGTDVMKSFLDRIPPWVNEGLSVAGNMLPALGFALLLNLMFNKKVAPYYFLGFILASYLKLPIIAIGAIGVIAALIITELTHNSAKGNEETETDTTESSVIAAPALPKKTIRHLFFRSLALEANFNFETWQNSGFAYCIIPALKKIYTTKQQMSAALRRHLQFFNTSPYGSTLIIGIIAAMEEEKGRSEDFDEESINSVKLGLMGPIAGVFDSLFWGTFKVIAAGVGVSFAIKGNILGPVLFLLIFNLPHLILRYNLTFMGYNLGTKFLQNLAKSNLMDKLTLGSSILGLMMIGAMTATLINISTPISFGTGGSLVHLQNILDQIIPNLLPLTLAFLTFFFVRKGIKPTWLLLGLLSLGFLSSILHVLK